MKGTIIIVLAYCILILACDGKESRQVGQNFVTSDITNFWEAFDSIHTTDDSLLQLGYLKKLFLNRATEGQQAMIRARNYTTEEYLDIIKNYPLFWKSIRENTLQANQFATEISDGVNKLNHLYKISSPGKIYFTVGAFRSPGTTVDSMVLIGSEFAFGDTNTVTTEFPDRLAYVKDYLRLNPIKDITFLNVHEYVHTQQKSAIGSNLLSQCIREGVAEFVATKALDTPSPTPAIHYGQQNDARVNAIFIKQMFNQSYGYWLWSSMENEFGIRDLGYYVGYAIVEKYYEQHTDKNKAINDLITLDFQDTGEVENLVIQSNYFSKTIKELKQDYKAGLPKVISITEFENGSQAVDSDFREITINFSVPMDTRFRSTDLGELGIDHFPLFSNIEFSTDEKSAVYQLNPLEKNKRYQMIIGSSYRSKDGNRLEPYLIEFKTGSE